MRIKIALVTVFLALFFSTGSNAVNGRTELHVNREYGGIYMVSVPNELYLSYETKSTHAVFPSQMAEKDAYIKLQFVNDNNELKESLLLKYIKIPTTDEQTRLIEMKRAMLDQLNLFKTANLITTEDIKINQYNAVIVHAQNGPFYLSILGILNPASHHCVYAIINIDPKVSDAKTIDDLDDYVATPFHVLSTFKFGRELM